MSSTSAPAWRTAILVATGPANPQTPGLAPMLLFAVVGCAGLVPYQPPFDANLTIGGQYKVQISVGATGRYISDVVPAGDGHG